MFRVLRLDQHPPAVVEGHEAVVPPRPGETIWIDIQEFTEADLNLLAERFKFHPLAIEDCLQPDMRAKLDEYDEYIFIVAHTLACKEGALPQAGLGEVDAFLGKNYLVTVHHQPVAAVDAVWKRFTAAAGPPQHGTDFIYYLIIDALVDEIFPVIDRLSDEIEDAESRILRTPRGHDLGQLLRIKRTLIAVRRVLSPERDVLAVLLRRADPLIDEMTALYFATFTITWCAPTAAPTACPPPSATARTTTDPSSSRRSSCRCAFSTSSRAGRCRSTAMACRFATGCTHSAPATR